jgi:hypothetical protein
LGLGHEGPTLRTSRAYIAGLGTTGVLIGSFFLLLTVGSTLVAFRGVPGQANNGDLSRIELRQQREAERADAVLLAARNVLDRKGLNGSGDDSLGDPFGLGAASGRHGSAGQIEPGATGNGADALRPGDPGAPAERLPGTGNPVTAPGSGTGLNAVPVTPGAPADDGAGAGSGNGTDTGAGQGNDSGSGSGAGSDAGTGSGSTEEPVGSGGSGSGDSGSDSSGSGDSGSGDAGSSGGGTTEVVDPVEETTGSAGGAVGAVSPGAGQTAGGTGSAVGGLLGDVTGVVDGAVDEVGD